MSPRGGPNSKESYSSGLANLAAALSNWAASRSGRRRGPRMRFPRFKTKKSRLSCRYTTCAFGLADGTDRRHIKLPSIGLVRTHESTRKLARRVEAGTARIRSATISFVRGRWFVSVSVEVQKTRDVTAPSAVMVGVDLGLKHLALLSTPVAGISDEHGVVANPDHFEHAQRVLKRLHRQAARRRGPDKRTKSSPSKRWLRTQSKIARLHGQVANARTDGLQQLTTALSERCGVIVTEDLNVAGMIANHRLARRISSSGWGELRRQLDYKTRWRGVQLVIAGPLLSELQEVLTMWRGESQTASLTKNLLLRGLRHEYGSRPQRRAEPGGTRGWQCRRRVFPELRGDAKRARWKPT